MNIPASSFTCIFLILIVSQWWTCWWPSVRATTWIRQTSLWKFSHPTRTTSALSPTPPSACSKWTRLSWSPKGWRKRSGGRTCQRWWKKLSHLSFNNKKVKKKKKEKRYLCIWRKLSSHSCSVPCRHLCVCWSTTISPIKPWCESVPECPWRRCCQQCVKSASLKSRPPSYWEILSPKSSWTWARLWMSMGWGKCSPKTCLPRSQ